jgi:hypothetical protein
VASPYKAGGVIRGTYAVNHKIQVTTFVGSIGQGRTNETGALWGSRKRKTGND